MQENDSIDDKILDQQFIEETIRFQNQLAQTKNEFDKFDESIPSTKEQEDFLKTKKELLKPIFDEHFSNIWQMVHDLGNKSYKTHRAYYQKHILPYLGAPEVNSHIYNKPLGYAGDFITMNYIFDQHEKFIGKTSFEKLINNYTCSIPISLSNITRVEYLKSQLLAAVEHYPEPIRISSIASGPARELIDLLKENRIQKHTTVNCLDFETKAFEYIQNEISKIPHKENVDINFIKENIISLIRNPDSKNKIANQNLIYAFGIYDYLNTIVAIKLTNVLFNSLKSGGTLIICNASIDKSSHRAYYEFLGEWEMIYRTKEEMIDWANKLHPSLVTIRDEPDDSYIYLIMNK